MRRTHSVDTGALLGETPKRIGDCSQARVLALYVMAIAYKEPVIIGDEYMPFSVRPDKIFLRQIDGYFLGGLHQGRARIGVPKYNQNRPFTITDVIIEDQGDPKCRVSGYRNLQRQNRIVDREETLNRVQETGFERRKLCIRFELLV